MVFGGSFARGCYEAVKVEAMETRAAAYCNRALAYEQMGNL